MMAFVLALTVYLVVFAVDSWLRWGCLLLYLKNVHINECKLDNKTVNLPATDSSDGVSEDTDPGDFDRSKVDAHFSSSSSVDFD